MKNEKREEKLSCRMSIRTVSPFGMFFSSLPLFVLFYKISIEKDRRKVVIYNVKIDILSICEQMKGNW
jgi:hypothetical protein